jgi:hypothetical protein
MEPVSRSSPGLTASLTFAGRRAAFALVADYFHSLRALCLPATVTVSLLPRVPLPSGTLPSTSTSGRSISRASNAPVTISLSTAACPPAEHLLHAAVDLLTAGAPHLKKDRSATLFTAHALVPFGRRPSAKPTASATFCAPTVGTITAVVAVAVRTEADMALRHVVPVFVQRFANAIPLPAASLQQCPLGHATQDRLMEAHGVKLGRTSNALGTHTAAAARAHPMGGSFLAVQQAETSIAVDSAGMVILLCADGALYADMAKTRLAASAVFSAAAVKAVARCFTAIADDSKTVGLGAAFASASDLATHAAQSLWVPRAADAIGRMMAQSAALAAAVSSQLDTGGVRESGESDGQCIERMLTAVTGAGAASNGYQRAARRVARKLGASIT